MSAALYEAVENFLAQQKTASRDAAAQATELSAQMYATQQKADLATSKARAAETLLQWLREGN